MVLCEVLACIEKLIKPDRSQSKIKHGLFSNSGDFVVQNYIHYDKCIEAHCKCGTCNFLCLILCGLSGTNSHGRDYPGSAPGAVVSLYSHIVYMNVYEWEYYVAGTFSHNSLMLPNLKRCLKRLSSTEMSAYKKQSYQSIVRPLV